VVSLVTLAVRYALSVISDGAKERDKKGRKGCLGGSHLPEERNHVFCSLAGIR
jgi:hypothetical protein